MNKREVVKQLKNIRLCLESAIQNEHYTCKEVAVKKIALLIKKAPPSISYELGCLYSFIEKSEDSSDTKQALCMLSRLME